MSASILAIYLPCAYLIPKLRELLIPLFEGTVKSSILVIFLIVFDYINCVICRPIIYADNFSASVCLINNAN